MVQDRKKTWFWYSQLEVCLGSLFIRLPRGNPSLFLPPSLSHFLPALTHRWLEDGKTVNWKHHFSMTQNVKHKPSFCLITLSIRIWGEPIDVVSFAAVEVIIRLYVPPLPFILIVICSLLHWWLWADCTSLSSTLLPAAGRDGCLRCLCWLMGSS